MEFLLYFVIYQYCMMESLISFLFLFHAIYYMIKEKDLEVFTWLERKNWEKESLNTQVIQAESYARIAYQ